MGLYRGIDMLDVMQEAELIRRVTRKVYWNSRYVRLRTQIDEEDLIQMVFLKLLHRENYKKYSDKYPLVGFIYRVANGCAISYANKASNVHEWTILDQPRNEDDDSRTILDALVSDKGEIDLDTQARISFISEHLCTEPKKKMMLRNNDGDYPLSTYSLFKFFITTKYNKKELHKHIINTRTNMPVTQITFDKIWKALERSVTNSLAIM